MIQLIFELVNFMTETIMSYCHHSKSHKTHISSFIIITALLCMRIE